MRKLFILSLLATMIAWGIGGCGGGSGGTSADPLGTDSMMFGHKNDATGTDWSLAIQTTPMGSVVLTAKVKNASGTAVAGREVTFGFKANQSGATLNASEVNTDAAGEATIIYTAGMVAGFDVVRASISNGATLDTNIYVSLGAGGIQIALEASQTSLSAGQNSILTATVTDSEGNPFFGEPVTFVLFSDNSGATLTTLNGTATNTTDGSGKVTAIYTAGVNNPTLNVQDTVKAGVVGASAAILMTRTGGGGGAGFKMTITAIPESLGSGQMSVITATATSLNADGTFTPVVGQTVNFGFVVNNSGAALTVVRSKTDSAGTAIATYTAGSGSPDISVQDAVTASVTDATGTYSAGAVIITRTAFTYAVSISPSPASVTAGQVSIITATVTSGSAPAGGVTVTFTLPVNLNQSGATLTTPSGTGTTVTATTDGSGKAVVIYQPGTTSPTLTVQDTVQAAVGTATSAVAITRTGSSTSAYSITVTASPATLAADNSNSVIMANVKNNAGTVISGVTVTFTVTGGGTVPAPGTATTDGSGNAVIIFTGGPGARPTGETDVVTATVNGTVYTNAVIITYP
jgi:hypothetical protein